MEPLSLRTSHAARTSPFLNRLNSLQKLSVRSWTPTGWLGLRAADHLWSETLLLLGPLLGPLLGSARSVLPPLGWLGPPLGSMCPPIQDGLAPSEIKFTWYCYYISVQVICHNTSAIIWLISCFTSGKFVVTCNSKYLLGCCCYCLLL